MLPDRVSNPGPLTHESGALPIALHGPAPVGLTQQFRHSWAKGGVALGTTLLVIPFASFGRTTAFFYLNNN